MKRTEITIPDWVNRKNEIVIPNWVNAKKPLRKWKRLKK